MSRERWGRQITKPSVAGNCMDKTECICKCTGADKGMGVGTKQIHTRNNNSKNQKIYTWHIEATWHKTCTRAHKTRNKVTVTPNPNHKTNKTTKTTKSVPARAAQATQQQNKKKAQTKPTTETINKDKKTCEQNTTSRHPNLQYHLYVQQTQQECHEKQRPR